jgi:hypothetical protein
MAKKHCSNCGEELSKQEIKDLEFAEEKGYPVAKPICEDCFLMAENPEPPDESFSDADPGL